MKPRDKIVLYANTCAEWMVCAIGAFRHSLAVVTIYTNLGEEGVLHGVTQTGATTVVVGQVRPRSCLKCSDLLLPQELLPRLLSILPQAPLVANVVVIPNHRPEPLPAATSTTAFHKLSSVLASGAASSVHASPPDPSDTAIIMYTSGSTGGASTTPLTPAIATLTSTVLTTVSSVPRSSQGRGTDPQ